MDYKQLMKDIKNNQIDNVYLFYGREFLLASMLLDKLKESLVSPQLAQLNFNSFDGKNLDVDDIINACETLPFMDKKKLIVVDNTSLLHGVNNLSPYDEDKLCKYIEKVPDSTCLVFTNKQVDKRKKLYRAINKWGTVVEYNKLDKTDLAKWIKKRFRLEGKKINSDALNLFIERCDYLNRDSEINLKDVDNEIGKVNAFTRGSDTVTIEDVDAVVTESVDTNIFRMLESIGVSSKQSFELLEVLIKNGESPLKILFMIFRQFRIIYFSKLLLEEGYSINDIAKLSGEKTFVINKALRQARRFSYENLIDIYKYSSSVDLKVKSGQIDPKLALEMLLVKINSKIKGNKKSKV